MLCDTHPSLRETKKADNSWLQGLEMGDLLSLFGSETGSPCAAQAGLGWYSLCRPGCPQTHRSPPASAF